MKFILLLVLCFLGWNSQVIQASNRDNALLKQLFELSGENLNGSSSGSVIALCTKAEAMARANKDYDGLFQINQIMVNAYCLKGDMALAIDKASKMYDEAKLLKNNLGIGLALQALGNTYTYTNRYKEADEALNEAGKELESTGNDLVKINLLIQRLFVSAHLKQPEKMIVYINKASNLIPSLEAGYRDNFQYYILYYQLIADIFNHNTSQADLNYKQLSQFPVTKESLKHSYYIVSSFYHSYKGDFERALSLSDSSLAAVKPNENIHEFSISMINKASVLEKMGRYGEAYQLYTKVDALNDSLESIMYSSQLDTLHVNYWVDQLQLETASKYNKLLTWSIIFALLILVTVTMVIIIIKRKNNLLELSRKKLAHDSEQASHSIQSKTLFLSNMSHEIRTPLNGIVGFSQLLATCAEMDDDTKHQCEESIRQNSDLLLKLINDVKDLSGLEGNEIKFTFDTYDAVTVCQNILKTVNTVKRTAATVTFTCPFESLELYTDSERLQQVLINLLINATKFTPQGSIRLSLNIDQEHHEALFTVEDTGCGIPLEKQSIIFNRFEKFHENIQGSGLGLSICQLIVEKMGGKIWIDSQYTKGARFVFTHPLGNHSQRN